MKKKTKKIVAIIVAALAIIVTGGVIAYLTDTDTATNTFTIGAVSIDLTEDNWNATNAQNVVPGQVINKDPAVENTGSNSAYVYIKVEEPIVNMKSGGTGPLLTYSINTGWTQLKTSTSGATKTTVFYYNTALATGATTPKLFNNVTVAEFDQNTVNGNKNMVVTAYAIQSNDLPSGTTIQNAYTTYFE
jgi:predicted ribosomally synthesized peptide with SipW-like signal peptide